MSFICSLPLISLLINSCLPPEPLATGYVEGEYSQIAPIEVTQIESIPVKRGDHVVVGQPLVLLERRDADIAVAQAEAALAQARSQLANLQLGARPEQIAVIEASLVAAKANTAQTRRALARQNDLLKRGSSSQATFDKANTENAVANAKVKELIANLVVARLPARKDEIAAFESSVAEANAALDKARWRLKKRTLKASQPGTIVDVLRDMGEIAGPQAPVLSLLPDGAIKLRLYLPEIDLASIKIGSALAVECDACAKGIIAKVSYISAGPEFTPPVIYSLENRQKLVYLIEARLVVENSLKPGQIVSVQLNQNDPLGSDQ